MPTISGVFGDESLSDALVSIITDSVQENETIQGVAVTLTGNAVVATDRRVLFVTEEDLSLEIDYEGITGIEVRTGWWSRGITFATEEGEIECDVENKDVVTAFGDIVRQRAPHIDLPESGGESSGLMGRVRGVFDTATGQDIRKYEEFVEASTTVLVGLHRDQSAMAERQAEIEDETADVRRIQEAFDVRLKRLEQTIGELREGDSDSSGLKASEAGTSASSMNRLVLVIAIVAIILSVASIVLRFV